MNVPISLDGLLTSWVGTTAGFGSALEAGTSVRLWLRRTDDLSGTVVGNIHAGAQTLQFTIPINTPELDITFAVGYSLGNVFAIELLGTPTGMNLTGYLSLPSTGGVAPVGPSGDDLTTLAAVKNFMNSNDPVFDTYLTALITASSIGMQNYMGRLINAPQTVTKEVVDSGGFHEIQLTGYPVQSVQELRRYGEIVDPSEYHVFTSTGIVRAVVAPYTTSWPTGYGAIEVDYTYGYLTTPLDLQEACNWAVSRAFDWSKQGRGRLGLTGTVLPQGGTSGYITTAFLPQVISVLERYRRVTN